MKKNILRIFILAVVSILVITRNGSPSSNKHISPQYMPPNEIKIANSLIKRGVISKDASPNEIKRAVSAFLAGKDFRSLNKKGNPLAIEKIQRNERIIIRERFLKSQGLTRGLSFEIPNAEIVPYELEGVGNILVITVEFSDPPHNQIPKPEEGNNVDLWVPDFNKEHYKEMLFKQEDGALTMANYYLEQSSGRYTVTGDIYDWISLDKPESWYGADTAEGGIDDANGPVWRLVEDVVSAAGDSIDWAKYDTKDPFDLDGDWDIDEPDGYVDHIMIVHAGKGEEAGGGAQGFDAIWSHSWFVNYTFGVGPGYGGVQTSNPDVWVGPYTVMPEDGGIGVFCHEFAHDLGLPDEYDTSRNGEASVGFWSLMASGSWLGPEGGPLDTKPSHLSPWGKKLLGWLYTNSILAEYPLLYLDILDRSEFHGKNVQGLVIWLPDKEVTIEINTPYSGLYEWWGGKGNNIDNTLSRTVDLTAVKSATLEFQAWYEIETDWDYAYVEVSTDGGDTFITIPGNITTDENPNGNNRGNGITGISDEWVLASFDLTPYVGGEIILRFRYITDMFVLEKGFVIDDIYIPEIQFFDDVEGVTVPIDSWTADGFKHIDGISTELISHYYITEWRTYFGFDSSLEFAYNWYGDPDTVQYFTYDPGLLVWYRDMEYEWGDNWVRDHPGHGFLGVVDAHPNPIFKPLTGEPWRTRVQIHDAGFGLEDTTPITLTEHTDEGDAVISYPSLLPAQWFEDKTSYWSPEAPDSSLILPTYDLNIVIFTDSPDSSSVLIGVLKY